MEFKGQNISARVNMLKKENADSKAIFIYLYTILIILVLICNTAVFITFYRMKSVQKKKIPNILLLHQAIVDFFIAICTVPYVFCFAGLCLTSTFYTNKFFSEYTIYLAIGTLMVCTTERFLCIKYPFYHHILVTKAKIKLVLVFTWIISLIPGLVQVLYVVQKDTRIWAYYIATAVILLLGVLMVFVFLGISYQSISQSVKDKIAKAKEPSSIYMERSANVLIEREEKKLRVTNRVFLLMSMIYTLTMLPLIIGQIVTEGIGLRRKTNFVIKRSLYLFYMLSSLVNPFLTLRFKTDFLNTFLHNFKKRSSSKAKLQPTTSNVKVTRM